MQTKRDKGALLEELILHYLKPIDATACRTKNSTRGDVRGKDFLFESKNWHTTNIIINRKTWKHLLAQLNINSPRTPVLVQQNKDGLIMCSLDIKDFFALVYMAFKKE